MSVEGRIFPPDSVEVKDDETKAVVYKFERDGKPCARFFSGRRKKADMSYRYQNEDRRDEHIAEFFSQKKEELAAKKARANVEVKLKPGDILYSSWGYEQTNIDYFKVTKLVGKTMVELVPIGARDVTPEGYQYMTGRSVANPDMVIGDPIRRKVCEYGGKNYVSINSFASAYPWNGQSMDWSSYH